MPISDTDEFLMSGQRVCDTCGKKDYNIIPAEQRLKMLAPSFTCTSCQIKLDREVLESIDRVEPRKKYHRIPLPEGMRK